MVLRWSLFFRCNSIYTVYFHARLCMGKLNGTLNEIMNDYDRFMIYDFLTSFKCGKINILIFSNSLSLCFFFSISFATCPKAKTESYLHLVMVEVRKIYWCLIINKTNKLKFLWYIRSNSV